MNDTVYVLGGAQTKFGELWSMSLVDLIEEAIAGAIEQTGIMPTDIDAIVLGNMVGGELNHQGHLGAIASGFLPHHPPAIRVESACASGGVAIHTACALLESNRAETVLVIGAEKLTDAANDVVSSAIMNAGDQEKDSFMGLTFPGIFALIANRYMYEYGLSRDDLSSVSAAHHEAAVNNPYAQFTKSIPKEVISKSAPVADPLRLLDCSPISDGAAAIVLSTKKKSDIHIAATQVATDRVSLTDRMSLTSFVATRTAFQNALKEASWVKEDIDSLELHDCFSIAAILHLEDMGFAEEGQGVSYYKRNETHANGQLPINMSGGLKACGHPIGATGVKQVLDCYKQLAGIAPNQVPDCRRALAHNIGGVGATCAITLLERE